MKKSIKFFIALFSLIIVFIGSGAIITYSHAKVKLIQDDEERQLQYCALDGSYTCIENGNLLTKCLWEGDGC